jgi:hypothetical protein
MQRLIVTFVPLLLVACSSDPGSTLDKAETWLIKNVSIVDTQTGSVTPAQSVVVKGAKISSVGPSAEVTPPSGAGVINGAGKFLIPGLWDMHIHTSTDAASRNAILPLLIANGITGARSMAADCHAEDGNCGEPLADIYAVNEWRKEIAAGQLVGPRLIASSYYTNGPTSVDKSSIENPATGEHARSYARLLNRRGVDLIKVYSGMYREAYFAMAEEARALGLEFAGHVPLTVRASEASDAGQSTIEHLTGFLEECSSEEEVLRPKLIDSYSTPASFWPVLLELAETFDEQKCQRLYEQLAENGTWYVPTLYVEGFYEESKSRRGEWREDPNLKYVPHIEVELWESLEEGYFEGIPDWKRMLQPHSQKAFQIAGDTHEAGVSVMAGSDPGEFGIIWGFSLHTELQYLVEAGLSEAQALQAATLNPARYRGMDDSLGTIEEGKLADMVLLNANPLEDISNTRAIDTVVANGRVFRRNDLDELLRGVEVYAKSTWKEKGPATE